MAVRGRGRPPKVELDLRIIVDAALALTDDEGAAALSVRRLAARLGVDPSALYRYVSDKDELHLALADRLFEETLTGFEPSESWRDTLRDLALRTRETALRHPGAAVLATYRTTRRPAEMRIVEHILVAFGRAGCSPALAAVLHRVYGDFALAWAGMDAAFESLDGAARTGDEQAWTREYPAADPAAFPAIARSVAHMARLDGATVFLAALETLLDGLTARIRAEAAGRRRDTPGEPAAGATTLQPPT
ncbi:TetR/AcrR family transcriptional regulator C-terminal domain-containing protein [Streptomyces sp. ISL-44]|uniref:TetR family transcriptional regulator n=1 Tax=Streptomyces sp. ISL-44 TaxID=2819184 RepID=UPI001BE9B8E3|nr:TetR/AcrR family transcriptional regulator C-terminal domain-containing protein [Streptomyces sp. ISL-44]MBT2542895.1 TetR/AcrR family transcriptional regulator C-terminal domain-containing protein [Streptomyces sp. ISL-44]